MTITVSGLGSGLDYESWITKLVAIKQADIDKVSSEITSINSKKSGLSTLESDFTDLQTAIQALTDSYSSTNAFDQKTVTSSDDAVSAVVTSTATAQNVSVSVSQLATATTAKSTYKVASYADSATTTSALSNGTLTKGTFSIYVNGAKQTISVGADSNSDTLGEIVTSIDNLTGVSASLSSDGKLTISADSGYTVTVGATSDSSNFTKVMSLTRDTDTGVYSSSKSIFDTSTTSALVSTTFRNSDGSDAAITAGTFTIGDTEFTIDSSTTLKDLINEINSSDAGVVAAWDSNAGVLKLTADDEGAAAINIEAGTSNFTDIMGLTSGGSLVTGSQTLGTNAILTINGTEITSASNTVTSDVSGITGLTLTLNDKTTSSSTVKITQDTDKITEAVAKFVDAYNSAITDMDTITGTDGNLYGESILNSLKNKIRQLVTASVSGSGVYKTLASIGITTGAVSTDTSSTTRKLVIDSDKLKEAITTNADAVKTLLVGDGTNEGVLDKVGTIVDNSLNETTGYFVTREKSFEKQADRLTDKKETMTTALEKYQKNLEAKFAAMDELISSLQNSASIFDSYFNKKSSSDSSS